MSNLKTASRRRDKTQDASTNEKQLTSDVDCCEKIRERAYFKWETAGCPCSDGVEFWLQAEAEVAAEMQSAGHASKR